MLPPPTKAVERPQTPNIAVATSKTLGAMLFQVWLDVLCAPAVQRSRRGEQSFSFGLSLTFVRGPP